MGIGNHLVGTVYALIIDFPAVENNRIGGVEAEMRQLTHVGCQTLVSPVDMVAQSLAEAPVGIVERICLENVVGGVECRLELIFGVVEIVGGVVAEHFLVEEVVTAGQCERPGSESQDGGNETARFKS